MPRAKSTFIPADNSKRCADCFLNKKIRDEKTLKEYAECSKYIWEVMGFQKRYVWGITEKSFVVRAYQLPVNKVATKCQYYSGEFEKGREVWKETGMVFEFGKWLFKLQKDRAVLL